MFKSSIPRPVAIMKKREADYPKGEKSADRIAVEQVSFEKEAINETTFLIKKNPPPSVTIAKNPINEATFLIKNYTPPLVYIGKESNNDATFVMKNPINTTFVIQNQESLHQLRPRRLIFDDI